MVQDIKLFEQAEIARYSETERRQYEESKKVFWDNYSVIKTAERKGEMKGREEGRKEGREEGRKEGREEGRKEGREEGREEGRKEIARKMKDKGFTAKEIAEMTGLSAPEITEL